MTPLNDTDVPPHPIPLMEIKTKGERALMSPAHCFALHKRRREFLKDEVWQNSFHPSYSAAEFTVRRVIKSRARRKKKRLEKAEDSLISRFSV